MAAAPSVNVHPRPGQHGDPSRACQQDLDDRPPRQQNLDAARWFVSNLELLATHASSSLVVLATETHRRLLLELDAASDVDEFWADFAAVVAEAFLDGLETALIHHHGDGLAL